MRSEDRSPRSSAAALEAISVLLGEDGGGFTLVYNPDLTHNKWTAGLEWGREAPDSDMAGAAAYGIGDSPAEAIHLALLEAGR